MKPPLSVATWAVACAEGVLNVQAAVQTMTSMQQKRPLRLGLSSPRARGNHPKRNDLNFKNKSLQH